MGEDDTTWWGGENEPQTVTEAALRAGHTPTEAAQAQYAYDALTPMVELDRQRRADATEHGADTTPRSVTETAQQAGFTPTEAAEAQYAYDALAPMVELDRQRRAEATDSDSTARLDDPSSDAAPNPVGGSFEDRSPQELDPGFTLRDDGDSPNPADMDRGFTPTPRAQLTFEDDEGETITARSSDSGLSEPGFSDSGFTDSRFTDSGFTDSRFSDSGFTESGFTDAGFTDSGFTESGFTDGSADDTGFVDE